MRRLDSGNPDAPGVTLAAGGANVAVASVHADGVELCLFDATGATETERIGLPERTGDVFHGFVGGIGPGTRYGLRVHGPWDPARGHVFNPAKLLVDPYARALDRAFAFDPIQCARRADGSRCSVDSAPTVPRAVAMEALPPAPDVRPRVPWNSTVVYELHVRGFTRTHPDVPEALRGTCAALAHPAAIEHLVRLGVTTVELMPVAAWVDERHLVRLGLSNYWGYNPVALLAPDPRLAPGGTTELRAGSRRAAGRRHRGHPRRRAEPHRRRRRRGADAVAARDRQRDVLSAAARRSGELRRRRRLRQHAGARPPAGAAPGDGRTAPLGAGLRGRRLPVRPRDDARTTGRRLRPGSAAAAGDRTGSRVARAEAHRRTLGHRAGRLPRRRVPRRLGRVERSLPRHRAPLLARRSRPRRRLRDACLGIRRPLRRDVETAFAFAQLRHRARRLHARRPGRARAQAQRGQRRGQPRRHRRQPLVEPRHRGCDDRRRGARAARARRAQPARDAVARPRHADARDGRRVRAQPARQQQRVRAGQSADLVRLGRRRRRPPPLHSRPGRTAPRAPRARRRPLARRARRRRRRHSGRPVAPGGRAAVLRLRLARRQRARADRGAVRAGPRRAPRRPGPHRLQCR